MNVVHFTSPAEFRVWLKKNHGTTGMFTPAAKRTI
jgi:hypothetical protein